MRIDATWTSILSTIFGVGLGAIFCATSDKIGIKSCLIAECLPVIFFSALLLFSNSGFIQ